EIWQATTFGTSGSTRPTFYVASGDSFVPAPQPVLDNTVTWADQGTSVVARYPVTGKSTLQALSLDPLVRDCSGANEACSTSVPTVSKFWLGDNGSFNFYRQNFAGASPVAFDANADQSTVCATPTCSKVTSIQGLRIYGAEGANQA